MEPYTFHKTSKPRSKSFPDLHASGPGRETELHFYFLVLLDGEVRTAAGTAAGRLGTCGHTQLGTRMHAPQRAAGTAAGRLGTRGHPPQLGTRMHAPQPGTRTSRSSGCTADGSAHICALKVGI